VQQRHTEVRYYDHFLLGGWVLVRAGGGRAGQGGVRGRAEVGPARRASRPSRRSPDPATLSVPTLMLHGTADTDCPRGPARRPHPLAAPPLRVSTRAEAAAPGRAPRRPLAPTLRDRFRQAEAFAAKADPGLLETVFVEGEGHGLGSWAAASQARWCEAVAAFLKRNLQPALGSDGVLVLVSVVSKS